MIVTSTIGVGSPPSVNPARTKPESTKLWEEPDKGSQSSGEPTAGPGRIREKECSMPLEASIQQEGVTMFLLSALMDRISVTFRSW